MSLEAISPMALYVPLIAVLSWYGVLAADVRAAHDVRDEDEREQRLRRLRRVIVGNRNFGRLLVGMIWVWFIAVAMIDESDGAITFIELFWLAHLLALSFLTRSITQWMTRAAQKLE